MKTLAAQALAYQYKLQIDTSTTIINNSDKALNQIDKALKDLLEARDKLRLLNDMAKDKLKEGEKKSE
tara:strand:- start:71 stop:274 length:204 start_codon:yes stop_codon:yes gene_type:complete